MSFGLTPEGFKRKGYPDILHDMESRAKELFGSDVNLSESSPLGIFIKLNAWEQAYIWQVMERVYLSAFVDYSEGVSLDRVCGYIGISRFIAEHSIGKVTFFGTNGTVIPAYTIVKTITGYRFLTTEEGIIADGSVTVGITSESPGANWNVAPSTIIMMQNPIGGVTSLTNVEATTMGRDAETDSDLRFRYFQSVIKAGAPTTDSIRAAVLAIEEVSACSVIENNTMEIVGDRPPKSFETYVYGGDDGDIALAIFKCKAAGIRSYGSTTVTVQDVSGNDHDVSFTRATPVNIYVKVTILSKTPVYPSDGDSVMRTEIVRYIGGLDADGVTYRGLSMGEAVVYTRIVGLCYTVPGVSDIDVRIGTTPEPTGTANISIGSLAVASTDRMKVEISS